MKKNLLTVLILALIIVNIVLTSVMMFSMMSTNKKTAELVTNIATVLNLELKEPGEEDTVEPVSMEDTVTHDITGKMTIHLANTEGDSKDHYVLFSVSLAMNKESDGYKTYGEEIATRESMIKDSIQTTVSAHTIEDCRNDMEAVKREILENLQTMFDSDFIYRVAISDISYQ